MAKKRKSAAAAKPSRRKAIAESDELDGTAMSDESAKETDDDKPKAPTTDAATDDLDAVHKEAVENYTAGWTKDRENQALAYDDLRFLAQEGSGQWDELERQKREAEQRPILEVNKCPQFCRQVTGDIRQMRPAIHVTPVDDAAQEDVAVKVLPGMLRYIEQRSDAKAAYFNAADSAVAAGIGHWRVVTEYASDTTRNQEIGIALIEDGISVVWDPDSIQPTRKDAMFCFVPIDMAKKVFDKRWPGKGSGQLPSAPEAFQNWYTDDHVRVAEYWRKVPFKREMAFFPDGKVVDLSDDEDGKMRADAEAAQAVIEERESFKVERYIISSSEVLEGPTDWDGVHIPIVPLIGEEIKIGRQVVRRGVVRGLKDVQRLYNYAISADAEAVALQPRAPFIGTKKNFEIFRGEWETLNTRNWPFLQYTPDPLNGNAPPTRLAPPVGSSGIKELLLQSTADMSGVTGIYPAGLGQASNETSGKAILARQREGDTGTYVYIEAFGRALQRTGEIIIDLIPHIYDTARVIRINGEDGKVDKLELNKPGLDPNGDGNTSYIMHDVTIGAYEVAVEMGPSFATKREEARDGLNSLLQALGPESASLYVDLFVKAQDFPLADKIAKRAAMALPYEIRKQEALEAGEQPPEPPPPPQAPPPTPQDELKKAQIMAQHDVDMKRIALDNRKLDAELLKAEAELELARQSHAATMTGHAITAHAAAASGAQADEHARADREHAADQAAIDREHSAGQADLDRSAAATASNGGKPAKTGKSPAKSGGSTDAAQDERVDHLVEAVTALRETVLAIAQAVGPLVAAANGGQPPGGPAPGAAPDELPPSVPLQLGGAPAGPVPPDAMANPGIAPPA